MRVKLLAASLAAVAALSSVLAAFAQDHLQIAVERAPASRRRFVTEVGDKAGLFKKHNLALDIFYTDGGGETQQAVISNSAQIEHRLRGFLST